MFQTTIARESCAEGVGLHTGVHGCVRLVPAPAETGIVFRRVDLDNFPIEAQGHNVARVSYATSLMKQGVLLSTTEHLLAAMPAYLPSAGALTTKLVSLFPRNTDRPTHQAVILAGTLSFFSTLFGGLVSLKFRDKFHIILGFAAPASR